MFDIQQLESIEFELANKCNARCPQCPRYSKGRLLKGLNKDELTLQDIKQSIDYTTISKLKSVIFKGTTGDPIVAQDFLYIVEHFKQHNPKIKVWIATNGGLHDDAYWQRLADLLNAQDKIVFGIDGLSDTHSLYRIGTDYDKVLANAKTFIGHGGNAHWQFIKFKHNQHQWHDCEQLSQQLREHQNTTDKLTARVNDLEKQLVKGKGFLAGAMLLSMGLGGVGSSVLSRWLGS